MSKRLITLRRIRDEKIDRSKSWVYAEIAAGRFPKPLPLGGGPNLFDEDEINRWLEEYIRKAKERAVAGTAKDGKRNPKKIGTRASRAAA